MATIEWALRRAAISAAPLPGECDFDWITPPGMARLRLRTRLADALRRERQRRTIDMASLAIARETGCR